MTNKELIGWWKNMIAYRRREYKVSLEAIEDTIAALESVQPAEQGDAVVVPRVISKELADAMVGRFKATPIVRMQDDADLLCEFYRLMVQAALTPSPQVPDAAIEEIEVDHAR